MKKIILAGLLLGCCSLAKAQIISVPMNTQGRTTTNTVIHYDRADTAISPRWVVGLYPFAFIGSNFMLGLEHRFTNKISVKVNGSIGFADNSNFYRVRNYTGTFAEAQFRYYPNATACRGFYMMGYGLTKSMKFTTTSNIVDPISNRLFDVDTKAGAFGFGAAVGGQFLIENVVAIDFYLGGGPLLSTGDATLLPNTVIDTYHKGIALHTGLMFGVPIR